VAATRAKKRLVVSGGWGTPGVKVPPEAAADFARLIGRRLDPEAMARQIDAEAERQEDEFPQVMRVMPVFGEGIEAVRSTQSESAEWSLPEARLQRAVELAAARRAAAEWMAQPVFRSASAEAHDRLRRAEAEGTDSVGEGASDQGLAMALGTAVHEMLEVLDLDRELAPQIAEHRSGIVNKVVSGRDGEDAERRADDLLTRIAEGECLGRLGSVAPNVLSRELPVLLWSEEEGAPGAVVSGIVDLVYRDPEDGRLVVADYKTDRMPDAETLAERIRVYEPQVRIYARALQEALDLDHRPHTELWFLDADRIVRL
jgi:ATP-dependent exoDNAse (exonuclease V) beta subunit